MDESSLLSAKNRKCLFTQRFKLLPKLINRKFSSVALRCTSIPQTIVTMPKGRYRISLKSLSSLAIKSAHLDVRLYLVHTKINPTIQQNAKVRLIPTPFFYVGCLVMKNGERNWKGRIHEIKGEKASVLIGMTLNWFSLNELYPLNSKGCPILLSESPNIFGIAKRGRENFETWQSVSSNADSNLA